MLKMHGHSPQCRQTLNPNDPAPFEGSRHCCCGEAGLEVLALLGQHRSVSIIHKQPGNTDFMFAAQLPCNFTVFPHAQS